MIITTTSSIDGRKIVAYKGIACGEVVFGAHLGKDILASFTNLVGGRSDSSRGGVGQSGHRPSLTPTQARPCRTLPVTEPSELKGMPMGNGSVHGAGERSRAAAAPLAAARREPRGRSG